MKSIAEQVTNSSQVPEKEYFIDKVGVNGAVVSTADELRAAIDAGKETICVYGQIDLGDISNTGGITLAENQKLVGVNYFGNFSNGEGFSGISGVAKTVARSLITVDNKAGCIISDLSIDYKDSLIGGNSNAIYIKRNNAMAELRNLDITMQTNESNGYMKGAICADYGSADIGGKINIQTSGGAAKGIVLTSSPSEVNILSDAVININTAGKYSTGMQVNYQSSLNIATGARVDIVTL